MWGNEELSFWHIIRTEQSRLAKRFFELYENRSKAEKIKRISAVKEDLDAAIINAAKQTLEVGKALGITFLLESWSEGKV